MTKPATNSTMIQKTFDATWSGDVVAFSMTCSSPDGKF
jgi:hypothetical protein